ncbi:MAG: Crp/Fnr family transcriptional regulator [Fidelibacterota bacterium]
MGKQTKLWYLQNFNLFTSLKEKSMEEMSKMTSMRTSSKKEIIYFPDEPSNTIYFLKEGKVKLSRISPDGQTTTLHLVGPGEIFGESAILGQEKRENFAEVVEDAVICSIPKEQFQEVIAKNPELNLSITKFIGFRMRRIQAQVEDLVFKTARERIESFIRRYVKDFGKELIDGWVVRPFLTHQEIANLTATTRQTASTILNDLVREGVIKYTRGYLKVTSRKWLK